MQDNKDPRQAKTLGEASANPDGTYNGPRALSWLSEVINPGRGLSEDEVRKLFENAKRLKQERSNNAG